MNANSGSFRSLLVAAACAILLAGCGADKPAEGNNSNAGGSAVSPTAEPTETPSPTSSPVVTPALQSQEVAVYLADEELTQLVEKKVTIQYGGEEELIEKTIQALQQNEEPNTALWHGIEMISGELEDGTLTLDIAIPDEARLGAPGEQMLVDSMKQTLFQFPFVEEIELLVQGEALESLMGHVELEHPMRRE
ncbi:GerMN domain-containing protein [Paenibacillus sp. LHD-117]|uniref:GerMN domain-containing protein n=1 Tax=Paenibacillus sp. LHD-117 TaxID=3071412 RepID=UPI0027E12938|nr:GerMN domain-containing protein [Paenibacillus sp. LHD-117]MDQ6418170.1 GerMN domain-containing protein [Paenibacillus sp. LHD-117]